MTQDPIDRLLWEHQGIMRQVADLRTAIATLARDGEASLPAVRPVFQATSRMIERELIAHARREDEALFPALERVFGREEPITGEMRREHRDIHAQADRFRVTLRELNEIEHPAIVREGERLSGLAGAGGAADLCASGSEMIRLLDEHFRKEEEILFPLAREVLDEREREQVGRAMEALDAG